MLAPWSASPNHRGIGLRTVGMCRCAKQLSSLGLTSSPVVIEAKCKRAWTMCVWGIAGFRRRAAAGVNVTITITIKFTAPH